MIAFSSVSMGNTIADEEVVNLDNKKEVSIGRIKCEDKMVIPALSLCEKLFLSVWKQCSDAGLGPECAGPIASATYDACLEQM